MNRAPNPQSDRFAREVAQENAERGTVIFASTNPYDVLESMAAHPLATCKCPECVRARFARQKDRARRRAVAAKRAEASTVEQRQRARLRSRRRSGRDALELAKVRRDRLRRAYVQGSDPTPQGRYTAEELDQLGQAGLALKLPGGSWGYPIQNGADLANALAAYKDPRFNNYNGLVRSWIVKRAIVLGLVERLPKGWAEPKYKPHPNEIPTGPTAGKVLPGGPSESGGSSQGGTAI